MGNAAAVQRTKPSNSFVVECDIVFDGTGGSFALAQVGGSTPGPGARLSAGIIYMGALNYGNTTLPLVAIGGLQQSIPVVGANYTVTCKWFFKTTAGHLAAVFVYNGITYYSAFSVASASSFMNFYSVAISQVASVGTLTLTDTLSDAQVQALYDAAIPAQPHPFRWPATEAARAAYRVPHYTYQLPLFKVAAMLAEPGYTTPVRAGILPERTGKVSHARILAGYRNEREAILFHKRARSTNI